MTQGSGIGAGTGSKVGAPPGVFALIAGAASDLLVRPWLLLLPLTVDLWLWGGLRLSPAALAEPIGRALRQAAPAGADPAASGLPTGVTVGDPADLLGIFLPSMLALIDRSLLSELWARPTIAPSMGGVLAGGLLAVLLGIGGLMAFLVVAARLGVEEAVWPGLPREVGVATLRYLGFIGLVLLVVVIVAVPATIGLAVAQFLFGLPIAAVVAPVGFVASLLLAFTGEAVVLARAGPLRAPVLSARLLWRHPRPTIGLLFVIYTFVISVSLLIEPLVESPLALLTALIVAAFVATVFALAKLRFFAAWNEAARGQAAGVTRWGGRPPASP